LHGHHDAPAGLELGEPGPDLVPYRPSGRAGKREIGTRHLSRSCLDGRPVGAEALEGRGTCLTPHANVLKGRPFEKAFEPFRIGQREGEMQLVALLRQVTRKCIGKDAPHRCTQLARLGKPSPVVRAARGRRPATTAPGENGPLLAIMFTDISGSSAMYERL